MCRVIAVSNQKGGVGKTVSCVNLGIGLAQEGKKVLLIDADPQGSLTISLGYEEPDEMEYSLATLMLNVVNDEKLNMEKTILHHGEGVDLIPANIELSAIEVSLVNAMSRELILRSLVDKLREFYDFILIDCMPSLGMMTVNALACADSVLIPVQAAYLPVKGLQQLIKTIGRVKKQLNPKLQIEGILLTMVDYRTSRVDLTCGTEFHKLDAINKKTRETIGDEAGMTGRQVTKYIRLTELISSILDLVDSKKITLTMGVDISYLDEQVQKWVYEYYRDNGFLKPVQVEALRNQQNLSNASQYSIILIMNDALPKKNTAAKVSFSEKKLNKYFPSHYSAKERETVIIQLLEQWSEAQKAIQ